MESNNNTESTPSSNEKLAEYMSQHESNKWKLSQVFGEDPSNANDGFLFFFI